MNKKLLMLAVASGFTLAGLGAHAQPAPGVADWSGLYVGLNGGYNWDNSRDRGTVTVNQLSGVNNGGGVVTVPSTSFPAARFHTNNDGFMGGGQVGFNAQSGPIVFGVEGDEMA